MEEYCIERNALTPEIYESLRAKVSLQYYGREDVKEALAHTLFSVVVREGQVPVGIGRIVGDGRIVFFIKDVVVEPSRQNRGIGHMIMEELMHYIRQHGCPNAYAGLMALTGKEGFYEKFGFHIRPYEGQGSGMTQLVNTELPSYCMGKEILSHQKKTVLEKTGNAGLNRKMKGGEKGK